MNTITFKEINNLIREGCAVTISNGQTPADGVTAIINDITYKVIQEPNPDDLIHSDDTIKIGDYVYLYTFHRAPEWVRPDEVVAIIKRKDLPTQYKLKKGGETCEVYKTRAELVARLIREDLKRHYNYCAELLKENNTNTK